MGYAPQLSIAPSETKITYEYKKGWTSFEYTGRTIYIADFDSEVIRGNFLLRYTYRPGSDLYIVYNEFWQSGDAKERSIVGKITYFLNI